MPKYRVYIDRIVQYYTDIEAADPERAEEIAADAPLGALHEYSRLGMEIRDDLTQEINDNA